MITLSQEIREQILLTIGDRVSKISLYAGSVPAGAGVITDQVLLVELTTPRPAYTGFLDGHMIMAPTDQAMVLQSGDVTFARLYDGSGLTLGDVSVGNAASNADLKFGHETASVFAGALVSLADWVIQ
ncbi:MULTISPECIES: hypothetical protein [Pseudoalteromonas]|uniref:hypothetical protein n=1 Tax=Pseudoalteromonas TaxID=53246 RepID=UPI001B37D7A1|nr:MULTISPECIES: hypothetical protein [Pseudoalteromonas]MBQ4838849.1 hypothetical protein [Pseudoalteromonas luteoviolacea]MCG7548590.1 hypothetical protein [Pseudoalteromonas sp. Of7M-16]